MFEFRITAAESDFTMDNFQLPANSVISTTESLSRSKLVGDEEMGRFAFILNTLTICRVFNYSEFCRKLNLTAPLIFKVKMNSETEVQ